MDDRSLKMIEDMLYNKNKEEILEALDDINNPEVLYVFSYNYNWDNGFEIPKKILLKDCCELSIALLIFYSADGISYLRNKNQENVDLKEWSFFIKEVYLGITKKTLKRGEIKFVPPLSKVEMYKLKKEIEESDYVFLEEIEGNDLNIEL